MVFIDLITPSKEKLYSHLWYMSEHLAIFSLFYDKVNDSIKANMVRALNKLTPPEEDEILIQTMPASSNLHKKSLRDFVGKGSWTILNNLRINTSFFFHCHHHNGKRALST